MTRPMTRSEIPSKIREAPGHILRSAEFQHPLSEITAYLGFASQSHLGSAFKKETGMTLSQYRKKYQMQEFMD